MRLYFSLILIFIISSSTAQTQVEVGKQPFKWLNVRNDRRYISDYTRKLNVRVYGLNKFTQYSLGAIDGIGERVRYKSNDNYNIGIGFNYRFLGLNVGMRMPFINDDARRFGRTKSYDLQSFYYFRRLTLDLYGQFYDGHYIADPEILTRSPEAGIFPQRSDLKTRNFGINGHYIFNPRRFSYRAAFVQNEQQKKSAGSAFAGANIYHFRVHADSAIIPRDITFTAPFWANSFTKSNITSLAVGGGYAYTLVIKKNVFVTGSYMAAAGLNYFYLQSTATSEKNVGLNLNGTLRLAAGYNSQAYFASIQYIHFTNRYRDPALQMWQQFQTGSIRLVFGKRITLSKKTEKKVLQALEDIKDDMEEIIR